MYNTYNVTDESLSCVKNFTYYGALEKNIIPFQSTIQDIFNCLVSKAINIGEAGDFFEIAIVEDAVGKYCYQLRTHNLLSLEDHSEMIKTGKRPIGDLLCIDYRNSGYLISKHKKEKTMMLAGSMTTTAKTVFLGRNGFQGRMYIDFHIDQIQSKLKGLNKKHAKTI
jgi:hypothetical protein